MQPNRPGVVRFILVSSLTVLIPLGFIGCAGAPTTAPKAEAPSWTLRTPTPDASNTYFVGYSDAGAGQIAQATNDANANLIAEIVRYMGVTITADTTATAKATMDSYQADLVQTVSQTSTSRVAGFKVIEKFVAERKDGVTVYILASYSTKDLEGERQRIAASFQEKIDAVAIPEAQAKDLLASGDIIGAARKFIEAAAAASGSDVDNAEIKFERNINAAKGAIARLNIEKLTDRLETSSGVAFRDAFIAKITVDGKPQAQVPVIVSHQTKLPNGRMSTKNANLQSNAEGLIIFDHPTPDFIGKFSLTMRLDLSSATEPLYGAPAGFLSMIAGLEDEIVGKRVAIEYSIVSQARNIATSVLIVDLDSAGNPSIGTTTSALLQTLSANGFKVKAAPFAPDIIMDRNDNLIYEAAKNALAGDAERFAYGTTRVMSVKDDRTQKIATVSAEIKVVDLATGQLLYSSVKQAPAVASSEQEAVEAARRQLGQKTIGDDMAASLP